MPWENLSEEYKRQSLHEVKATIATLRDLGWRDSSEPDDLEWWSGREAPEFATFDEIDALHTLFHKNGGLYRPDNGVGCDKFWCLTHVPALADAMKNHSLRLVKV
jgi:hypothetical protein